LTGQYGSIRKVLEVVKLHNPNIITVVGGGIITSAPVYGMKALELADYGVIGEGEIIVCNLCTALENNHEVKDIAGIVYYNGDDYAITEGKPEVVDINKIPYPDYEGFCIEELLQTIPNIIGISASHAFPILTSRGCPFKCTFCFHPAGQKYRQRTMDDVFGEIDFLLKKYDIRYLNIQDELFSHSIDRVRDFCQRIKKYNIKWFVQFRVTDVTPELVQMVKEANCTTIGFGIESADNTVLKSMNKRITVEDTNRALELVYNAGLGIQGCLIFGDKAETIDTAKKSIQWWKEHIQYGIQLSVVGTYPGSALFEYALKEGLITDPVQFIQDSCPTVRLSKMSDEEYAWVMEQILSLQRSELAVPHELSHSVNYENGRINLRGTCNSCGTENYWKDIRLFIAESITCSHCGRRHYSPIPREIIEKITQNLIILQKNHGKICFWGVNSFFYDFANKMPIPDTTNLFFVDKSEIRWGIKILGRKIESTNIISDEKIDIIIVAVPQYFSNLAPSIAAEYPHVKKIMSIIDLLSENFPK